MRKPIKDRCPWCNRMSMIYIEDTSDNGLTYMWNECVKCGWKEDKGIRGIIK